MHDAGVDLTGSSSPSSSSWKKTKSWVLAPVNWIRLCGCVAPFDAPSPADGWFDALKMRNAPDRNIKGSAISALQVESAFFAFSHTIVAPQPPDSGGASLNSKTLKFLPKSERTMFRCVPVPRP
jgi:hypothetical protein